jgi:PncC family amidohydrolase
MKRIVNKLIKALKEKSLKMAFAESMTCGLAAHQLSTTPGTADVFAGSIVCYTPEVKCSLLHVSERKIKAYSCESKEVTEVLAKHLPKLIKADLYAAITGLASPGGSETPEKPVGTVFYTVLFHKKIYHERKRFRGTPLEIRKKACNSLYEMILRIIEHSTS